MTDLAGAQVSLGFNTAGSRGARGTAAATIYDNTAARDAYLISVGLDPVFTNGPMTATDGGPYLPIQGSNLPKAQPDGSPPVGAQSGDLYNNGGFLCIAP